MLSLVIALALGANTETQAFVISPHHRLGLPSRARGHSSSSVSLSLDEVPVRSYGAPRKSTDSRFAAASPKSNRKRNDGISMRVRRNGGGDVEIQGAGGETRRVQRRARRRPDLRSMQKAGLQTAAAVLVQQERGVDVDIDADVVQEVGEDAQEVVADDEMGEEYTSLAEKYEAAQGLKAKSMMEEEQTGTVLDKYTQIYIPADGIVIKKTYGFWTWQVFGFIFIQHFVRNIIRKGGSLKKTSMSELNWDHIVTEPEHLLELKAYCCEECGYTLFPARGRHEVFFDEVEDFKCPECDAPRSAFFDANDKDDPHNIKRNEALEAKTAGEGDGGDAVVEGTSGDAGGGDAGSVSESAARGGAPSAVAEAPKPTAPQAAQSASGPASGTPTQAPPEASQKSAAAGERESRKNEGRQEDAESGSDDDDDLLDF